MSAATSTVTKQTRLRQCALGIFKYGTVRILIIDSKIPGVIKRVIMLLILAYFIGYVIVVRQGYQEYEDVSSVTVTKVKGVAFTDVNIPGIGKRAWDVADVVIPPQENNALFIMTNLIVTPNQAQGKCGENPNMPHVQCKTDYDCPAKQPVENGNGIRTGKCVASSYPGYSGRVCEVYAWCPVEVNRLPVPKSYVLDARNFSILIKSTVEFIKFNESRRNIIDEVTSPAYLRRCRYRPDDLHDKYCPVFTVDTILSLANQTYADMAVQGGVIAINIHWDCNLNYGIDKCRPVYFFRRVDWKNATLAKGWNFRYAHHYRESKVEKRTLIKAYGIRFIIEVTGRAGKFNIKPLLVNVGSTIGLLGIATFICEFVVANMLKKRALYKKLKYLHVKDQEEFEKHEMQQLEETELQGNTSEEMV